jgi:hypothetical protein
MHIFVDLIAVLAILCQGLFYAINRMGRHTGGAARLGWLLLTTAALAVAIAPMFGRTAAPAYVDALLLGWLVWYLKATR